MSLPVRMLISVWVLFLCVYGLYSDWHMLAHVGKDDFWSNPWFYKAHAALALIIITWALAPRRRR